MDGESPSRFAHRRGPKDRADGGAAWKSAFLDRLKARVQRDRDVLLEAGAARKRGSADARAHLFDVVAEEDAARRDEGDDLDRDLTDEERLEFMLWLEQQLFGDASGGDAAASAAGGAAAASTEFDHSAAARLLAEENLECGGIKAAVAADYEAPLALPAGCSADAAYAAATSGVGAGAAVAVTAAVSTADDVDCAASSSRRPPPTAASAARGGAVAEDDDDDAMFRLTDDAAAAAGGGGGIASSLPASMMELRPSDVLCPVCARRYLFDYQRVVFCRCGFRLDTAHGIGVRDLQEVLGELMTAHRAVCDAAPAFQLRSHVGGAAATVATGAGGGAGGSGLAVPMKALWMACAACGDEQLVM